MHHILIETVLNLFLIANEGSNMKVTVVRSILAAGSIAFLTASAYSQLSIDATGPMRGRKWPAIAGRGGGSGTRVPLLVTVHTENVLADTNGKAAVTFILTNSGTVPIAIPISPNPADVEPADPTIDYKVETLGLCITPKNRPGAASTAAILSGSAAVAGTLIDLAPGESVEIRTRVNVPSALPPQSDVELYLASAMLDYETIKTLNGRRTSDIQEIGSARSKTFTLNSLFQGSE